SNSEAIYSLSKAVRPIVVVLLETSHDGKYVRATVANGDGGDYAFYLLGPSGQWKQIAQFSDQCKAAALGRDQALYLLSNADAPRGKVLRLPLEKPKLANATVVVPPGEAVIQHQFLSAQLVPTSDRLYVGDLFGGPSQI